LNLSFDKSPKINVPIPSKTNSMMPVTRISVCPIFISKISGITAIEKILDGKKEAAKMIP
jgi:hypothetical protein